METRTHRRRISSDVTRGLVISGLSALYGAAGYLGYLGKRWIADGHDKPALLGFVMGLGIAGFHYLGDRAERIGSIGARRQFAAASIIAGIVWVALIAGSALLAAILIAATLIIVIGPWLPSPFDFRELLWREPGLVTLAGILLGATVLAAISEIVVRRNSLNRAQLTQTRSPYDSAWPETTIAITSVAFLLSIGIFAMIMFPDIALMMAGRNASAFPEGARPIVTWLAENHNLRWALPGSLVMFAAIAVLHSYRRARWSGGMGATPKVLDSAMKVAFACTGLSLFLLVLGFAASLLGAK